MSLINNSNRLLKYYCCFPLIRQDICDSFLKKSSNVLLTLFSELKIVRLDTPEHTSNNKYSSSVLLYKLKNPSQSIIIYNICLPSSSISAVILNHKPSVHLFESTLNLVPNNLLRR